MNRADVRAVLERGDDELERLVYHLQWQKDRESAVDALREALDDPSDKISAAALKAIVLAARGFGAPLAVCQALDNLRAGQPELATQVARVLQGLEPFERLGLTEKEPRPTMHQSPAITGGAAGSDAPFTEELMVSKSGDKRLPISAAAYELETDEPTLREWLAAEPEDFPRAQWETGLVPSQMAALRRRKALADIRTHYEHPEAFLDTPNLELGGDAPRDVLGTDREHLLFDYMMRINHGMVS